METKSKKMSNEGHTAKVPHGGTIGLVFVIGIIVGSIVVFLAVAGRTESVIQQRRELLVEKNAKAEGLKASQAAAAQSNPSDPAPAAESGQAPAEADRNRERESDKGGHEPNENR